MLIPRWQYSSSGAVVERQQFPPPPQLTAPILYMHQLLKVLKGYGVIVLHDTVCS